MASHAALLIALCLALYLPGFASLPPMDRDEPRFAQASKQMLETGDFVAIRFQDEARNKKPVGIYWMQAATVAAAEALGLEDARRSIWLYRIPSLLGAIATVLATYWAALALTDRRAALIAATLVASTILLTVEAHLAKTDAVTAATIAVAMGALARAFDQSGPTTERRKSLANAAVFWTALGIGILVKGPITPLIPALAALALCWRRRSARWLSALHPLPGLLWMLCLILPWFVLILLRTKGAFFSDAVGHDMLGKVAGGQELHGAPPGSYLAVFWLTAWPLAPFAALAAPAIWRRRREDGIAFLLAWLVPAWLLFEAVPTKLPHYVLPLYPALAIIAAVGLTTSETTAIGRPRRFAITTVLMSLMPVAIVLVLGFGRPLLWSALGGGVIVIGGVAVLVTLALAVLTARDLVDGQLARAVGLAAASAVVAFVAVFGVLLTPRVSDRLNLSDRLAQAGEQALGADCKVKAFASANDHEPSLVFLTQTDLLLTGPDGAAHFLDAEPCRAAFVSSTVETAFRAALQNSSGMRAAARVSGTLINGGKALDIAVYVRQGERP